MHSYCQLLCSGTLSTPPCEHWCVLQFAKTLPINTTSSEGNANSGRRTTIFLPSSVSPALTGSEDSCCAKLALGHAFAQLPLSASMLICGSRMFGHFPNVVHCPRHLAWKLCASFAGASKLCGRHADTQAWKRLALKQPWTA